MDQVHAPNGKINSFSLGRRIIRNHTERLTAEITAIEPDLESTAHLLQQAKEEKQELKKNESQHITSLQKIQEVCKMFLTRIEDNSPIFVESLAESVLNIDGDTLRGLLDAREKGLKVEREIWNAKEQVENNANTIVSLTERKKKLKSQLNKLLVEKELAQSFIDHIQELLPQKCVVCLDKAATHAIVPCGHRAVCETCGDKLKVGQPCPVCRKKIEDVRRIYFECPSSS